MLKREKNDSAFSFCSALEWRQTFREFLHVRLVWRRMRLHAPHLRLPLSRGLIPRQFFHLSLPAF
jgi:hypothetical protein